MVHHAETLGRAAQVPFLLRWLHKHLAGEARLNSGHIIYRALATPIPAKATEGRGGVLTLAPVNELRAMAIDYAWFAPAALIALFAALAMAAP